MNNLRMFCFHFMIVVLACRQNDEQFPDLPWPAWPFHDATEMVVEIEFHFTRDLGNSMA